MISFRKYLLIEFKLLITKYYLTIPSAALIFYLFYGYTVLGRTRLQGFNFLRTAGFLAMGLTILSVIIGVINERQEKQVHFDEVMDTLPALLSRHLAKFAAWLLYVSILCSLFCTFVLIWVVKDGTGLERYGLSMIGYIFMNFGIPMLTFWLLGYTVSRLLNPRIGWPLLLVLWYLSIPFNKGFISLFIQQIMNQFDEEPHGNRALVHYGLELNWGLLSRKLWILLVALGLFLLIYLFHRSQRLFKSSKSIITASIIIVMFICSIPLCITASKPHSQGVIWNNYLFNMDNVTRYQKQSLENADEGKSPEPSVQRLDIVLMPQNKDILSYKAKMMLKDTPYREASFTLYRTLSVINVQINKKTFTDYKQERDWITFSNLPAGEIELEFEVTGNFPIGLGEVTDHTLMLTPDSPWYPIPGKWKVLSPLANGGAVANKLQPEMPFDIHIVSERGNIITNLGYYKAREFSGKARGPAIIQGDYESAKIDGIHFVAPTQYFNYYNKYAPEFSDSLNRQKKELADLLNCTLDKDLNEQYDQYFMVLLPELLQISPSNFKSLGKEVYVCYMEFEEVHRENQTEYYESLIKLQKPKLLFECYWRNKSTLKSVARVDLLDDLFRTSQTGDSEILKAVYDGLMETNDNKVTIELAAVKKVIEAKSKSEKMKTALEVIAEWTRAERGEG